MKQLLTIAFFSLVAVQLLAQTLTARVNRTTVGLGEHIQASFTIEGDASGFEAPTLEGFRVLSGPNKSSSMQWVNGAFSSSKSYSYILMPTKEGELTIGPAFVKGESGKVASEPIKVNVLPAGQQARRPRQAQQNPGAGNPARSNPQSEEESISDHVFMKLIVDKKEAFVGEQVVATYKLYYDIEVGRAVPEMDPFNGFFTQDLEIDPNRSQTRERINGKDYMVATMKKVVLTPQKTGELTVPSMNLSLVARIQERRKRRSIFDDFFGNFRDVRANAISNKELIQVKALPKEGQPADFTGAVGTFSVSSTIDRDEVAANDAINLTVVVEGKGNLALTAMPNIELPVDFESYDPKTKENITTDAAGSRGKKTYEFVMIPRFGGDFEIKPINFSYFDPEKETYQRVATPPLAIRVNRADDSDAGNGPAFSMTKKEDVQILGKDIRFIKTTEPNLQRSEEGFFGTPLFYLTTAVPFGAMAAALFLFSFFRAQYGDEQRLKSRRAGGAAKKHLAKARKQMNASNEAFFEEISAALFGYISDKLGIPTVELTRSNIGENLRGAKVSDQTIDRLNKALDECEMVRFAPGAAPDKASMLSSTESIIETLEDEL